MYVFGTNTSLFQNNQFSDEFRLKIPLFRLAKTDFDFSRVPEFSVSYILSPHHLASNSQREEKPAILLLVTDLNFGPFSKLREAPV